MDYELVWSNSAGRMVASQKHAAISLTDIYYQWAGFYKIQACYSLHGRTSTNSGSLIGQLWVRSIKSLDEELYNPASTLKLDFSLDKTHSR